jgi:hypothetical protein
MRTAGISADTITTVILGILQLGIGLISLWQQRQLRHAYRKWRHCFGTHYMC